MRGKIFLDLKSERAEDKMFKTGDHSEHIKKSRGERTGGGKATHNLQGKEKLVTEIFQVLGMAEKL